MFMISEFSLTVAYIVVALLLFYKIFYMRLEHDSQPNDDGIIVAPEYETDTKRRFDVNANTCFNRDPSLFDSKEWTPDVSFKKEPSQMESTYQINKTNNPEVVLFCKSSVHANDSATTKCKQVKSVWHRFLRSTDSNTHKENEDRICMHDAVRLSYQDVSNGAQHGIRFVPAVVYFHNGRNNNSELSNPNEHQMAIFEGDNDINQWKTWITNMRNNQSFRATAIQNTKESYKDIYPIS